MKTFVSAILMGAAAVRNGGGASASESPQAEEACDVARILRLVPERFDAVIGPNASVETLVRGWGV